MQAQQQIKQEQQEQEQQEQEQQARHDVGQQQQALHDPQEQHVPVLRIFTPVARRPVRRARRTSRWSGVCPQRSLRQVRVARVRLRRRLSGHVRRIDQAGRQRLQVRLPGIRRHARRLGRRIRWWGLVMISRRRTVVVPLLGPLSPNGLRIWIVCIALAVWGLTRVGTA